MNVVKGNTRQSNIELLRLLAGLMVMVHHFNLVAGLTRTVGFNRGAMFAIETVAICAVDLFIIVSGFFSISTTGMSLWKPIKLLLLTSLVGTGFYLASLITGSAVLSVKGLVSAVLPSSYYVIFYCVMIVLAPYINFLFRKLSRQDLDRLMITALLLFSVYATVIDAANYMLVKHGISPVKGISSILLDGSDEGYTILNFLLLYAVGGWLRLNEDRASRISTLRLLITALAASAATCLWTWATNRQGFSSGISLSYCSPFIITQSACLLLLFRRIPLKHSRVINSLAAASLTAYLCHTHFILRMGEANVAQMSVPAFFGYVAVWVAGMYLFSYIVHRIYTPIERLLFAALERRFGTLSFEIK